MFNKLSFSNTTDEFNKYKELKGEYLYKQIYDLLLELNNDSFVTYKDLSSIIRYDKTLRDTLYIYLATFEEWLKALIFKKYDVADSSKIYKSKNDVEILIENIIVNNNNINSNLYYCFELDLGSIISFIDRVKMFEKEIIEKFDSVRKLRNKVMHHNVLICGKSRSLKEFNLNKELLKIEINLLSEVLPEEYQKGFKKTINDLKCDVDNFKILLE